MDYFVIWTAIGCTVFCVFNCIIGGWQTWFDGLEDSFLGMGLVSCLLILLWPLLILSILMEDN